MNIAEWLKACDEDWAPRRYDNASREIQRTLKYNPDPNATTRHHLRDTEEQREYNDKHYELWGFEIDENGNERFEYGKYVIFVTDEEHLAIHHVSEETREKISDTLKNSDKHPWRNKQLPDYVRQKISDTKKNSYHPYRGTHLLKEHRASISESLKGHSTSEETKSKISESLRGHEVSEETRHKLSTNNARAMLGKSHSDEAKTSISKTKQFKASLYNRYKSQGGLLKWNAFNKYFKEIYNDNTDTFNIGFTV